MVLKVYLSYIYDIYNGTSVGLTFSTLFSQLYRVRIVLSRWAFYEKMFFPLRHKKMLYSENW